MPEPPQPADADLKAPPSRHRGARTVTRTPNLVRTVTTMRQDIATASTRVRPEEVTFVPAEAALGLPCTAASLTPVHTTLIYRSGRALYVDLMIFTGAASVVEAQLQVPDLGLSGTSATTAAGGTQQRLRVQLTFPDAWPPGEDHLTHLAARRVSGSDATTCRVLRARMR